METRNAERSLTVGMLMTVLAPVSTGTEIYVHKLYQPSALKPLEVRQSAEAIIEAHFNRHEELLHDQVTVTRAKQILVEIIRRESQFRNIANDNDHNFAGQKQSVYGYAQFREDTFQEMFKSYLKQDGSKVPAHIRERCVNEWRTHEMGLECQVEVMSFAYRKAIRGNETLMRRWSTYADVKLDHEVLAMR